MNQKVKKGIQWAGLLLLGVSPVFHAFGFALFDGGIVELLFILGAFYFISALIYKLCSKMETKHIALGLSLGFSPFTLLSFGFNAAAFGILAITIVFLLATTGASLAVKIKSNQSG